MKHNEIQLYVLETFDEKDLVMAVFDDMCDGLRCLQQLVLHDVVSQ